MEHYAWHQHVNLAYYEGVKDGASGAEKKTVTGLTKFPDTFNLVETSWLKDYIQYYDKGYDDGKKQDETV